MLIPKNDRKINGAFFTPNYIVNFIIKEVSPEENQKCLDPSSGCGAFLVGLVEYFTSKFGKKIKDTIRENIYGSDILEYNVNRAKIILAIYGLLNNEILEETDFNIYHQDSLRTNWNIKFDAIVGNPPYVKYQDLADENRSYLMKNWSTIDNGTFNLYFAFFELGYKLLTDNGRLGFITPNNYFTSLAGLSLRQYFSQHKCLDKIIDFSHKKVFDAQTYTAISFISKKNNESILYDKIKDEENPEGFLSKTNGSPNYIKNMNVKKWRLLKTHEQQNIKIIETIGTPIKQLFSIAVGIATLKDEVFFVDSLNESNGYGIYFNKNNSKNISLFDDYTHPFTREGNILLVQKVLNSVIMDYYVTKTSISIQGGFPCYQKNFIEKFTIPYFFTEELEILRTLSEKDEIDDFLIRKYQLNLPGPNRLS